MTIIDVGFWVDLDGWVLFETQEELHVGSYAVVHLKDTPRIGVGSYKVGGIIHRELTGRERINALRGLSAKAQELYAANTIPGGRLWVCQGVKLPEDPKQ